MRLRYLHMMLVVWRNSFSVSSFSVCVIVHEEECAESGMMNMVTLGGFVPVYSSASWYSVNSSGHKGPFTID